MMVDVDVILEVGGTVDVGVVVDVEEVVNSVVGQDAVFNKKISCWFMNLETYTEL